MPLGLLIKRMSGVSKSISREQVNGFSNELSDIPGIIVSAISIEQFSGTKNEGDIFFPSTLIRPFLKKRYIPERGTLGKNRRTIRSIRRPESSRVGRYDLKFINLSIYTFSLLDKRVGLAKIL